jgi:hypothetical protein
VLQRHLQASYEHFAKAGYIIRPTSKAFDGWEGSLKFPRLSNFEPCQFLTWQTSKGGCYKVFKPFWVVFQAPYIHFRPGTLWQSTSHWAPSGKKASARGVETCINCKPWFCNANPGFMTEPLIFLGFGVSRYMEYL